MMRGVGGKSPQGVLYLKLIDYCGFETLKRVKTRADGLLQNRSIHRLVEFTIGIYGYHFTHEWIFYVFESVPMLQLS
jgi:hypothetical protein